MTALEERMAHLEGAFQQFSQTLGTIDGRFDAVDRRFDSLDRKIDARFDAVDRKIDSRFDTLDLKIDRRFMWTIGVVLSTWLTTILAVFLHR